MEKNEIKISILLPYENAASQYKVWATTEDKVDFLHDIKSAVRCTMSFAALELVAYLSKLGFDAGVGKKDANFTIALSCDEVNGEEFIISAAENGIEIKGLGRAGVLYGAYELLEAQGVRWYTPFTEFVPKNAQEFVIPELKKYTYAMPLGRGFEFEGPLKESPELFLWMGRNRFTFSGLRPHT